MTGEVEVCPCGRHPAQTIDVLGWRAYVCPHVPHGPPWILTTDTDPPSGTR